MGAAGIELPVFVTERTVEEAYRQGRIAQRVRRQSFADTGMRAARKRDPRLMLALEKGAEVLRAMSSRQIGETFNVGGIRVDATEFSLWREAYAEADRGEPLPALQWVYGMAAWLCGYNC
jgi:hypothetical protein